MAPETGLDGDRPERLLVVDDDPGLRLLLRAALERHGFDIVEAEDGALAVDAFVRLQPCMVLMDVLMPQVDGFTACRRLRATQAGRHVPVLMMTGLDDLDSINAAYEAGATDFITKPINWELLVHRVRYMLRASRAMAELALSRARLADAQRIARIGHWELDIDSGALSWSDEVYRIFGLHRERFVPSYEGFLSRVHPEDREAVGSAAERAVAERASFSLDYRIVLPDGALRHVHEQGEVMGDGKGTRMMGAVQDITERKLAEELIRHLAYYDSLTDLPNRRLFHEYLVQALALAQHQNSSVAVLFLDLDHFKRFNDTLGHSAGDQLLKAVAERLTGSMRDGRAAPQDGAHRPSASVARLGGDEFTILLPDVSQVQEVARVARRVLEGLNQPLMLAGHEVVVSASIGIVVYPFDGQDAKAILLNAEAAMYHAKEQGRNNYQFYSRSLNAQASEKLSREHALRKALERGELTLHFQPQVAAAAERIVGSEALVRWEHPELGMVAPGEFIPLAEETGLIIPMGEWVLHEACRQNRAWQAAGLPPLRVAVNMSASHFRHPHLVARVARTLEETGLDPRWLELEVTETALMHDHDQALRTLQDLKAMGVRLAIDDFGTGYSSLAYLKRFPLNALKIDRCFVRDVHRNPEDAAIVQAILSMGRSLRLTVIAEGVETVEQRAFLAGQGCDELQGFLYSRPVPADGFAALLRKGSFERTAQAPGNIIPIR